MPGARTQPNYCMKPERSPKTRSSRSGWNAAPAGSCTWTAEGKTAEGKTAEGKTAEGKQVDGGPAGRTAGPPNPAHPAACRATSRARSQRHAVSPDRLATDECTPVRGQRAAVGEPHRIGSHPPGVDQYRHA